MEKYVAVNNEMHVGLHVKCLLSLSEFKKKLDFLKIFS